ncbi:MAG: MoaD/ThiS family protein [Gemmataceae bacterium]
MMPRVWIPPALRDLTGGKDVVAARGSNVRAVIAALEKDFPGIAARLCDGDRVRPGISVIVDSNVAPLGLLAPVKPDSEVHFLPAIGGGS